MTVACKQVLHSGYSERAFREQIEQSKNLTEEPVCRLTGLPVVNSKEMETAKCIIKFNFRPIK